MIRATHPDFQYTPTAEPEELHNAGRIRWVSGRPGEAAAYAGTDFIIVPDGRIAALYFFFDSFPAILKNAIDWVSRPAPGEPSLVAFRGKVATLMSASPGALGGRRGLDHIRSILGNIGVIVLPDQIAVAQAHEAFNSDGTLKDPKRQAGVEGLGKTLASFVAKLKT